MYETFTLGEKFNLFLRVFIPMFITQLALIGGNFVAVFMTGQYSTSDLAGMSMGFNIWITWYTATLGVIYGITPIISNMLGAKILTEIKALVQNGLYMATALGALAILAGYILLEPFLSFLHLTPQAHYVCTHYMAAIALCAIPLLWVCVFRNVVDAHGLTHYSMAIIVSGFFVNCILNYLLIFGHFGFPELGGIGAGYATALSVWFNVFAYVWVLHTRKAFRQYSFFKDWVYNNFMYWKAQLAIGLPIGIAIFCEISIFSLGAFVMAFYGTKYIAAQQAALSFSSLFYCVPLTISLTATILVAFELGANRYKSAKQFSNIARVFAIFMAIFLAGGGFTYLDQIANLYTTDSSMVSLIASFLSYAICFSIIDAFGTPVQGILRGYKDVNIITVIAIICFWFIGVPVAAIFSILLNFGPYGVWVGMLTGVGTAAICYILRLYQQERKYRLQFPEQFN